MPERIGWGLVGCGDIANKRVAPALKLAAGSQLRACIRKNPGLLREFQLRHQIPQAYMDYSELLDDPEIDAVYLATPVFLHCPQTIMAAKKGKHVLCEKPMAMDSQECRRMIEACRSRGVKLGIAYYRRFFPIVLKIKELLEHGSIGEPILVRVTLIEHTQGALEAPASWRFIPDQGGGGLLMDMVSHRLDLLAMLFGCPHSVSAVTDTRVFRIAVEDTGSLLIRFASGVHALAFASHCVRFPLDDFEVFGTRGHLKVSPLNGSELQLVADKSEIFCLPKAGNVHLPLIEDFNRALFENRDPLVTGEEGMKASLILEAAYRSAQSGEVVKFSGWDTRIL
jgi:predicted dehydrogenase